MDVTQSMVFTATVKGGATDRGVNWSLSGPGTLSHSTPTMVTYTAPAGGNRVVAARITATSNADSSKRASVDITVNPGPSIRVSSSMLPTGTVGAPYAGSITAEGGIGPYTWSVQAGALPNGLKLGSSNFASETLSGTPTSPQTSQFTVVVRDAANLTASTNLSVTIDKNRGGGGGGAPPNQLGTAVSSPATCPPSTANPPVSGGCVNLTIRCPEVPDYSPALLKVTQPAGTTQGTIIFTTGGGGNQLYEDQFVYGSTAVRDVVAAGFTVVQTNFAAGTTGWLTGPAAGGPLTLACRWATTAQWVHDNLRQPSAAFCATGNSGGSGAVAYALSRYGMDSVFDYVLPTSGPPFSRIDEGCLCQRTVVSTACVGRVNTCYGNDARLFLDPAYGNHNCSRRNPANTAEFRADSILSSDGKSVLSYSTRVHFLFGGLDDTPGAAEGSLWQQAITSSNDFECVAQAPHKIADVLQGAQTIANDLIAQCH